MWKLLAGLFTGPLSDIADDLKEAYQSRLQAENNEQKIAADERIALLEARKSSILAAQSDPVERWVRVLFSLPFILYVNKLVIWDKILGWGTTPNLSEDLWTMFYIILGGYFVDTVVRRFKK